MTRSRITNRSEKLRGIDGQPNPLEGLLAARRVGISEQ